MKLKSNYFCNKILFIINLAIIQIAVNPVTGSLSYENKDFVKIKQDPTRFQQASAFNNHLNIYASKHTNETTVRENNNIVNNNNKTVTQASQYKKWQVGRVSRKQYEIINMLWRKTKIFVNLEQTTANNYLRRDNDTKKTNENVPPPPPQAFIRLPSRPIIQSTTSSYIEFYYLDETDERGKESTTPKHTISKNMRYQLNNLGNFKFVLADSPMFAFRINDPNYKRSVIPTRYMHPTNRMRRRKTRPHDSSLTGFGSLNGLTLPYKFPRKRIQQNKIDTTTITSTTSKDNFTLNVSKSILNISAITTTTTTSEIPIDNETCHYTTESAILSTDTTESEHLTSEATNVTYVTESTTAYDKIKFFEIYDKHTVVPHYDRKGKLIDMDYVDMYVRGNELNNERKILLEHVDQSIGNEHSNPHKAKHAKKHIIDNYKSDCKGQCNENSVEKKVILKPVSFNITNKTGNVTNVPLKKNMLHESEVARSFEYKKSKHALWSEYPFSAAYVYEPSQVHCDAAGISPHWLITSGSCLSRHHKKPGGVGRSAFVTYCGESWWNPERVAYVKYSLVHPRFHTRDKTRKHLYNIGLIQVVTSMASACNNWSPISLMSHQFIADSEGSIANAIGWGLDRFDTRYSSNDLPKTPLMTYESQVFSDSCPGNVGYSKAKRLDEEGGVKNVYCLSLPPYSGEENDPVHGGLLLVGGKLVALYLQEERRPWGDQCAQYTGTWRLVPWVVDVARESEDVFTLDI